MYKNRKVCLSMMHLSLFFVLALIVDALLSEYLSISAQN